MSTSTFATVAALHLSAGSAVDDDEVQTTVFGDDDEPIIDEAEDPDDDEGPTKVGHVSIRG